MEGRFVAAKVKHKSVTSAAHARLLLGLATPLRAAASCAGPRESRPGLGLEECRAKAAMADGAVTATAVEL